jgi:hypothetical protein
MSTFQNVIKSQKRFVSWHLLVLGSLLIILSHIIFLYNNGNFAGSDTAYWARVTHIFLAVLILIFTLIKKEKCASKTCTILFVCLYLPFYYMQWLLHRDLAISGLVWVPIASFRLHFFALALLVPGSYLINFILMSGFALEAALVWFYFDIPHLSNAVTQGEPVYSLLFFVISLSFLAFRYRDEKIIKKLYLKQARLEVFENLARVFLSIRDKSNTPIQTLGVSVELLKKKNASDQEAIIIMENAVKKLTLLSEVLKKTESKISNKDIVLMSDEELQKWFMEIDKEHS